MSRLIIDQRRKKLDLKRYNLPDKLSLSDFYAVLG